MKRTGIILALAMVFMFVSVTLLSGCTTQRGNQQEETGIPDRLKVGIVLSTGGRGDKSFNDAAIVGLEKAKKDIGIDYKDVQPKDVAEDERSLEFLAKGDYDLIFAVGFMMGDALAKVAPKYPEKKFAIIDYSYVDETGKSTTPANVKELVFKEHEGSFLAGALAGMMTKSDVVGFVGGMDMPLIHRFEGGFTAGAKYVNPDATVLVSYAGTDSTAFNNPDRGKEIALDMISKKADIIYHASGGTGQGVFEASEGKALAIGVDSNQNWVKPGTVVASMIKRVDVAVYDTIKSVVDGTFKGGTTQVFGLEQNGVGLTDLSELTPEETQDLSEENQEKIRKLKDSIPSDVKKKIDDLKNKIINGEIKVPDWMLEGKPKT